MDTYTAARGWIEHRGETVDEALCLVMRGPRSFTGEDVVEFHCHGGPAIIRRTLEAVLDLGARLAAPGEFTRRAFLSGRIDLAQAEAVADMVAGETDASVRAAARQLEGGLSQRLEGLRRTLVETLALLEASVDFSEHEDVQSISREDLEERLDAVICSLAELIDDSGRGRLLREGARLVIAGRPNVGKSTLMNALLRKERVIVTPEPGTTRDIVEEALDIGGVPVRMLDTAGIRAHAGDIEKLGVELAKRAVSDADFVVMMIDGSSALTEDDRLLAEMVEAPAVVAINKSDLPAAVSEEEACKLFPPSAIVRISALQGEGLDGLETAIAGLIAKGEGERPLVTNARHEEALNRTREAVTRAREASDQSEEFIAVDIRQALEFLFEITGETVTDEVLDHIFSRFCVGK